jgi:DNA-binding beta-propeller fold protein YncE
MVSNLSDCIITLFATLFVWSSLQKDSFAQVSNTDQKPLQTDFPHVEWVKNWPSADKKNETRKLKDRLNSILFGIKTPVLCNPVAVFALNPEDYWILDQGGKTIFQIQNGLGDIPQSVRKTEFALSSFVGICGGANSSILFTDSKAGKIYSISPDIKRIHCLNDSLELEQPTGIAYNSERKEIWVIETKAHCITVLNENGGFIKRIGSRGNAPGEFNYPTHIWIDRKGYIFVTDALNFRIQMLDFEGTVLSVFGEAGDGSGFLARPKGIATDSFGNIYVADALFHVVQVFDIKGNYLYKFGNQGHGNGEFWMPMGIYIDDKNYIYVADTYNARVQVFQLIQAVSK